MLESPVTFPSPLRGYSSGRVSKGWDAWRPPPTRLGIIGPRLLLVGMEIVGSCVAGWVFCDDGCWRCGDLGGSFTIDLFFIMIILTVVLFRLRAAVDMIAGSCAWCCPCGLALCFFFVVMMIWAVIFFFLGGCWNELMLSIVRLCGSIGSYCSLVLLVEHLSFVCRMDNLGSCWWVWL